MGDDIRLDVEHVGLGEPRATAGDGARDGDDVVLGPSTLRPVERGVVEKVSVVQRSGGRVLECGRGG